MYQEEVAKITADHLRTHISSYLATVQAIYTDAIKLQVPKSIETDNLVGGVYNAEPQDMPAYAVDIIDKAFAGTDLDALWIYTYGGHIAGVVSGGSEASVNMMIKRHEQAVEKFVRDHQFMHQQENVFVGNDFRFKELRFIDAAFSGAELVTTGDQREVWMAGFRVDLAWDISESGPWQHA